jgi:D-threo-aldose 1-dehydrogenase
MTSPRFIPHGPLGMGGAPLGNLFRRIEDEVAAATVQAAWDADIRHFDTAPHYGAGLSEHRFGAALREYPRDEYTLSTKVGRMLEPDESVPKVAENFEDGLSFRRRLDYGYDGTLRSIEDSLQRLGLPRIDIAYIHDCGEDWLGESWREQFDIAMKGAARALTRLREEGTIRAWGLGVNVVEPCLLALEQADPDLFLVAGRYTLLDHTALPELLPQCEARGVGVVIGGPFNSGLLAGGTTFNYAAAPPAMLAKARAIGAACARYGVDLKAAALQFVVAHPAVAAVIPGPRTVEEVTQNAAAMAQPIPDALWAELRKAGLLPAEAPTPEQ